MNNTTSYPNRGREDLIYFEGDIDPEETVTPAAGKPKKKKSTSLGDVVWFLICLCAGVIIGACSTIKISQALHPTSTYINNKQIQEIAPIDVIGYPSVSDNIVVNTKKEYNIVLVPISTVCELDVIAFSFDDITMQYGIVSSSITDDAGDTVLRIYQDVSDSDPAYIVTGKEFRGIVIK